MKSHHSDRAKKGEDVQKKVMSMFSGKKLPYIAIGAILFGIAMLVISISGTVVLSMGSKSDPVEVEEPVTQPPTEAPTVAPTEAPTDTPPPAPPPPVDTQPPVTATGCEQFDPSQGQATVTVNLIPNTGTMTGDTVVRLIPTGSCPNESPAQEHWMSGGELSWTTSPVNPGRYRIEVANGHYQGVVSQNVDLVPGHFVLSINVTSG